MILRILFAVIVLAWPAASRTVEVKAFSRDTWVAWRSVSFQSDADALPATCVKQSSGDRPCSGLTASDPVGGWWNANKYSGSVTFRLKGRERIDAVRLAPCCGDEVPGVHIVLIQIKVDGKVVHLAKHEYSLEFKDGAYVEIKF